MLRDVTAHAFAALLFLASTSAYAGGEDAAAQLFNAGKLAFQRKDYTAAAKAFEEADHVLARAGAKYNAAIAWELAGEPARAADLYAAAKDELSGEEQREATRRLSTLERELGLVNVLGPSTLRFSLAHVDGAAPPRVVHAAPGVVNLSVRSARGDERVRTVNVRAGEIVRVELDESALPPPSSGTVEHPSPLEPPPRPEPLSTKEASAASASTSGVHSAGWIFVGASAVMVGGYATSGILALSAKSDFEASGFRDADAHDRAATTRLAANIFAGAAVAFGITGIVLLLQPTRASRSSRSDSLGVVRF